MADAKYICMVPKQDNLGNPLANIAAAAHHFLYYGPVKNHGTYIDPDKIGHWRDDPPESFDLLVTYAEDTPQMDSEMKQLAVYIGELANQWGVMVFKESKNGPTKWEIANPMYRHGEPAEDVALAQPEVAQAPVEAPRTAPPSSFGADPAQPQAHPPTG